MPLSIAHAAEFVDVPLYRPTVDESSGYIWLCDRGDPTNYMVISWTVSQTSESGMGPTSSPKGSYAVNFLISLEGNGYVTIGPYNPDHDILAYSTISLVVYCSSSDFYRFILRSDPGVVPSTSVKSDLSYNNSDYESSNGIDIFIAGNAGISFVSDINGVDVAGRQNMGNYNRALNYIPRWQDNQVSLTGPIQIDTTASQQAAIDSVTSKLESAANSLSSLSDQMNISRPSIDSDITTPIQVELSSAAMSALSGIASNSIVSTLLLSSLTVAVLFIILRGTIG